jgi:hypothetical protein
MKSSVGNAGNLYVVRTEYKSRVRFQVLTAASMKVTAFLDIAPCRLVEVVRRTNRPDDGGSSHLRNVGQLLRVYTAQYPRRHTFVNQPARLISTRSYCSC